MEAWIGRVGRIGRCGSNQRTGPRRGLEAWIGGLGLGPLTLRPAEGHGMGNGAWRGSASWVGGTGRW